MRCAAFFFFFFLQQPTTSELAAHAPPFIVFVYDFLFLNEILKDGCLLVLLPWRQPVRPCLIVGYFFVYESFFFFLHRGSTPCACPHGARGPVTFLRPSVLFRKTFKTTRKERARMAATENFDSYPNISILFFS